MIEAGVVLGMPRSTSTELVVQTLFGAATMLKETGEHPTVLRERVSSPGGTTVAALRELDDHKVRAAFIKAMEAAAKRSSELAALAFAFATETARDAAGWSLHFHGGYGFMNEYDVQLYWRRARAWAGGWGEPTLDPIVLERLRAAAASA